MSKYDDHESDWIIAIANTAADGIPVYRFRGTADKVRAKLAELAKRDMENDPDDVCVSVDDVDDVDDVSSGCGREFRAYIEFSDYHITYRAIQWCQVDFI